MSTHTLPPQIVANGDTARVRETDPVTSHIAADMSALTITEVRRNVLWMINHYGPLVGSELNAHYPVWVKQHGWKQVRFDSVRKRAGELADAGFLVRRGMRYGLYNTTETEYELTVKGLEALEVNP